MNATYIQPARPAPPRPAARPAGPVGWRRTVLAVWGSLALLLPGLAQQPGEYELKAAVLCNLAKFVEWPTNAAPPTRDPLVIGLIGTDPFGPVLDRLIRGQTVQGRELAVRRFQPDEDLRSCQVLFVSRSETGRVPGILARVRGARILTVSESSGFAERGGMVNLVLQDDRVRFEMNVRAAEQEGLKISSKLQKYATRVVSPPTGPEPPP